MTVEHNWELWGPLAERYRTERPRRVLALDGGGIRGLMTLGVLARLESELRVARGAGEDFRLCQFFDLIGGTSTGAIIAAGLSRGLSVEQIRQFYNEFATTAFAKRKLWQRWQSLFGEGGLAQTLRQTFGEDTDLSPTGLECLLTVVTRNATTDSAWPISSNPSAKYNDPDRDDCNLRIPLWQLVRASTAAPVFFPPEVVSWDAADPEKSFVFVDGGTTAYNNPAFLLFKMATEPAYRLGWPTGEQKLLVVSVGTGSAPVPGATADDPGTNLVEAATNTLSALMSQASVDQDVSCRVIGRCTYGGVLDRELHDLVPIDPGIPDQPLSLERDTGKAFLYVRYNAELTGQGLDQLGVGDLDATRLRKMDDVDNVDDLVRVGAALGKKVDLAHLGSFAVA
jgi:predicted acylesterase/phospholipase RssA